jgi:sigma-B regulation protein RsbU (phosphoserine phosphatase)
VRRRSGEIEEIPGGGVLLGVRAGASYDDVSVELGSGDALILFTDGLTEARRGDDQFGTAALAASIGRSTGERAALVLETLIEDVRAYTDRPLDDLTVVVLRQLTGGRNGGGGPVQIALKSSLRPAE